jgi:hypothetical protein
MHGIPIRDLHKEISYIAWYVALHTIYSIVFSFGGRRPEESLAQHPVGGKQLSLLAQRGIHLDTEREFCYTWGVMKKTAHTQRSVLSGGSKLFNVGTMSREHYGNRRHRTPEDAKKIRIARESIPQEFFQFGLTTE